MRIFVPDPDYATADTTSPVLTSLSFPSSIDVTTGGKSVAFSAGATDVGLGVANATVSFKTSWQGSSGSDRSVFLGDNSGDTFADGISIASEYIDRTSGAGRYEVDYVYLTDKAGNYRFYYTPELTSLGFQTSFTLTSSAAADTTSPVLTSLSFPSSIDVTTGGKSVAFSAGATDVGLGVANATVSFKTSWQGSSGSDRSVFLGDNSGDTFADGISIASEYIDRTSGSGRYEVDYVYVTDKAGNYRFYYTPELTNLGFQTSFTLTSSAAADTTSPVLTSLSFPSSIDVTTGGKSVAFSAGATDVGLGVANATVSFKTSWQGSSGSDRSVFLGDNSGDTFADGISIASEYIDRTSGAGRYEVDYVYLTDKAGNYRFYYTPELTSLGFQTSFTLVDQNVGPTAYVTAPASIAEDGGQSLALSLTIANVTQASGTVTMAFASAQSTVTNGSDVSVPAYSGTYSVSQTPAGNYIVNLPPIAIFADQIAEGTETLAVTIRASGQIFDTGTDTKTVMVSLIDSGQTGTAGPDTLTGTRFADNISGFGGNDILRGGAGNDAIDGGSGYDTAVFSGFYRQSTLTGTLSSGVMVVGPDGRDAVTNTERFQFADGAHILDADAAGAQIIRIYDSVLNRAPDDNGLDFYLDRIEDQGGTLLGVANELIGSAEFQRATGGLTNSQFVDYVYQHTLGRAADAGGKDYYTGQLDQGGSRGALMVSFSESVEHRGLTQAVVAQGYFNTDDNYQAVALLYDGAFGRLPDASGLTYYGERVKSGAISLSQVAADFAGSGEFQAAIQGKTNAEIVDFIYGNSLHRAPDAGGRAYYTGQLDRGGNVAQIFGDIGLSPEHYNLFAPHITHGIDLA